MPTFPPNRARARVLVGLLYLIIALLEDIVDCARTTVRTHIGCALHDAIGFKVIREHSSPNMGPTLARVL